MRNIRTRVFSPSSSSSSRSHSSSSSSSLLPQTQGARTMEEVWRDLTFPHPPHPNPNPNPNPTPNPNPHTSPFILQDFLAGTFKGKTPPSSSLSAADHHNEEEEEEFPLPQPPPTALSLNSSIDFRYNSNPNSNPICSGCDHITINGQAAATGSPTTVGLFSFCPSNKRVLERDGSFGASSGDRRNKRMMKNRESAARSRARKQAYTNELELEVAQLAAENEKLRKQFEELRLAMAAQRSTKKILQRTSTAPF